MKIFRNKFFISFLILTTVIYGLSANVANAGGIGSWFGTFLAAVITVVAVVVAPYIVPATLVSISGGTVLASGTVASLSSMALATAGLTTIVTSVSTLTIAAIGAGITAGTFLFCNDPVLGGCGNNNSSGVSLAATSDIGCAFSIPLTFYNSVQGCFPITENPNNPQHDFNGTFIGDGSLPDDAQRQVAIYRYTLPVTAGQTNQDVYNWLNGINFGTAITGCSDTGNVLTCGYVNNSESNLIAQVDYSKMCDSSGVCKFTDQTVPPDSYILYAAKIIGSNYGYGGTYGFNSTPVCYSGDNKFLAGNSNTPYVELWAGSNLATNPLNGYIGPYKTDSANCPLPPTIDSLTSTPVAYVSQPIYVSWSSSNTISCVASSNPDVWNGDKSTSGQDIVNNLARGNYTFNLSCSDANGQSVSASANSQVLEVPLCAFSANPSTIKLPEISTLSWNCKNAQTCSISPTIGNVDAISGSKQVRPTDTTTFSLNCQGRDGSQSYTTTVNVGSTSSQYQEVPIRQ